MNNTLQVTIASVPDREQLVAEIWSADIQFAELSQEGRDLQLEIYPGPQAQPWSFEYSYLLQVLREAAQRLREQA